MKIKVNGKIKDVRLPKRFKEKWVKALRSGEILQGSGELLSHSDKMCCIGVAGRICGIPDDDMLDRGILGYQSYDKSEIEDIQKQYKFPKLLLGSICDDEKDYNPLVSKLANMNDSGNWSFKRIAAYIERYL